jgi:hypothetical protein
MERQNMMKLMVHKINCPYCKTLITGKKEKNGNQLKVSCPKCQHQLWTHDGRAWHYTGMAKIRTA